MQLKGIKLPFTQEEYNSTTGALTPLEIQTAFDRIKLLPEPIRGDILNALAAGIYLATPERHGKATIRRIQSGKRKAQYKVLLTADNGKVIDPQNESYHNLVDLTDMLEKYYPGFTVSML